MSENCEQYCNPMFSEVILKQSKTKRLNLKYSVSEMIEFDFFFQSFFFQLYNYVSEILHNMSQYSQFCLKSLS